jgi:hypothetical protein
MASVAIFVGMAATHVALPAGSFRDTKAPSVDVREARKLFLSGTRSLRDRWPAGIAMFALLVLYGALLFNVARFIYNAYLSVLYPGELDYAEGIVWQQAELTPSVRMYGDLRQYPFFVFQYPPVYHLVVNAVASFGASWLAAGRLVSIVSLLIIGVATGTFVAMASRERRDDSRGEPNLTAHAPLVAALIAGLLIFSLDPLRLWARVARVDMLAYAFEMIGICLGLRALLKGRPPYGAAFIFVVACYTKQTVLAGAIATFLTALLHDWRGAVRAMLPAGLVGALVFVTLTVVTGGGFARNIILYNVNRFSVSYALAQFNVLSSENMAPAFDLVAVGTLICLLIQGFSDGIRRLPIGAFIVTIYFLLGAASLLSLGKSGSNSNYLIPVTCAAAMLTGLAVAGSTKRMNISRSYAFGFLLLIVILAAQSLLVRPVGEARLVDVRLKREIAELIEMMRASTGPVFSENMVFLMQAGKEVPWEPSIITELTISGIFNEQKILDMIYAHAFSFVAETDTHDNVALINSRYTPAVRQALETNYPVKRLLAGQYVMFPSGR